MSSIVFKSYSPEREVNYVPRQDSQTPPRVWAVVPDPRGHEAFMRDLLDPKSTMPSMVKTVTASGVAAEVVASRWAEYETLRQAVAENPGVRWGVWATGVLAMRGAVEASQVDQSRALFNELASEETKLRQRDKNLKLHPVAAAMRSVLHARIELASLNGSTPPQELMPPTTYANPAEIVGMVALDLASQPEPALAEA